MTQVSHEISVPGRYDRILEVCQFVIAGAEDAGFDADDLFKIELACDEACTNVIEHAYGTEDQGEIRVVWELSDQRFLVKVFDKGRPFKPESVTKPVIPDSSDHIEELKIGGLGIHFMRKLMDEIYFSYDDSKGNQLLMIKYLPPPNKQ